MYTYSVFVIKKKNCKDEALHDCRCEILNLDSTDLFIQMVLYGTWLIIKNEYLEIL